MALKLKDLKINETYEFNNDQEFIMAIGEQRVFSKCIGEKTEASHSISDCLKYWSLRPKPKKVIEYATFEIETGSLVECRVGSDDYRHRLINSNPILT